MRYYPNLQLEWWEYIIGDMAFVFDGKKAAEEMAVQIRERVTVLTERGIKPTLIWITVGEHQPNTLYGHIKMKAAEKLGITFESATFDGQDWSPISEKILRANEDTGIHGMMVQLPVMLAGQKVQEPRLLELLQLIAPEKDVDCLHPQNHGRILAGAPLFLPATVASVMSCLEGFLAAQGRAWAWFAGKRMLIVGGGLEIGKPLVGHASNLGMTVLWARSQEQALKQLSSMADVIVSATGTRALITGEMVRDGVIAIDVGAPHGDFEFESVQSKASFITPVPGGVGPLTVMHLMKNVVSAAEKRM